MRTKQKLAFIRTTIIIGMVIAITYYLFANYILGIRTYPGCTFLFNPGDRFHDYSTTYEWTRSLAPYKGSVPSNYFPFTFIVMTPFVILKGWLSLAFYLISFISFSIAYIIKNFPESTRRENILNVLAFSFLTYPFLFLLDRGSIEGLVFAFFAMFVWYYHKQSYSLAAGFLAAAAALKAYPAFFVILFFAKKKYRSSGLFFALAVLFTVSGMGLFDAFNIESFQNFFRIINGEMLLVPRLDNFLLHSSSLLSLIRITSSPFIEGLLPAKPETMVVVTKFYLGLIALLTLLISGFVIWLEKTLWKQMAICTAVTLLFPIISFDYKLIHLVPVIFLFIQEKERSKFDWLYCLIFGLLMIPKTYWIIHGEVTSTSLFTPALLVLLVLLITFERLRPQRSA